MEENTPQVGAPIHENLQSLISWLYVVLPKCYLCGEAFLSSSLALLSRYSCSISTLWHDAVCPPHYNASSRREGSSVLFAFAFPGPGILSESLMNRVVKMHY